MKIEKIKIEKNKCVKIDYIIQNAIGTYDKCTILSTDSPSPALISSFKDLAINVCEISEFPDEESNRIEVDGLSIKYINDKLEVKIHAKRTLYDSDSPIEFTTPAKIESFGDFKGSVKSVLSAECAENVKKILNNAKKFIAGHRAQLTMFCQVGE